MFWTDQSSFEDTFHAHTDVYAPGSRQDEKEQANEKQGDLFRKANNLQSSTKNSGKGKGTTTGRENAGVGRRPHVTGFEAKDDSKGKLNVGPGKRGLQGKRTFHSFRLGVGTEERDGQGK